MSVTLFPFILEKSSSHTDSFGFCIREHSEYADAKVQRTMQKNIVFLWSHNLRFKVLE